MVDGYKWLYYKIVLDIRLNKMWGFKSKQLIWLLCLHSVWILEAFD